METEQLYVGDERICPRTNYENDGAAEKIRQTRELLDELAVRVAEELLKKTDLADWAKRAQKPEYTAPEVGADAAGSASGALADAKAYADGTYMQATGYTDSEIAKLINGSQTTLETIKQLSDAMRENEDIVDALENAMGSKASEVEFQAHAANETVHVTESEKEGWNAAAEHGRSGHAPANAERNTIAGIKRNGSGLVPDRDRNVDITVPTKISQLENDVMKKIAFSGQYSDLTGAPTSLKNPQALSFSGAAAGNYDGSAAKSVHIPSGTNGLMATAAGTWLDAVQGKALKGLWDQHEAKINKINSDLTNLSERNTLPIYANESLDCNEMWPKTKFTVAFFQVYPDTPHIPVISHGALMAMSFTSTGWGIQVLFTFVDGDRGSIYKRELRGVNNWQDWAKVF